LLDQATIPAETDVKLLATQMGLVASADSGADALVDLCRSVIEKLPAEAESVRKGKEKVVMRLVGQVMKDSKGTADAKKAREVLLSILVGETAP
jgi:aspartyl-tRNA(Asn)/glutamyl-tRNA(Gln) amidotransferase subunit B